jgi:hypothetical protein
MSREASIITLGALRSRWAWPTGQGRHGTATVEARSADGNPIGGD